MTTTTYTEYAMVQRDTGTIYGVGTDLATATDDARRELSRGNVSDSEVESSMATLSPARITSRVGAFVRSVGGAPSRRLRWGVSEGMTTICIDSEEE